MMKSEDESGHDNPISIVNKSNSQS
jgi:hypothetical protein